MGADHDRLLLHMTARCVTAFDWLLSLGFGRRMSADADT
jgi:hypothetical protein